jgi:hypothetical protein
VRQYRLRSLLILVAVVAVVLGASIAISKMSPEAIDGFMILACPVLVLVALRSMFGFVKSATPIRRRSKGRRNED